MRKITKKYRSNERTQRYELVGEPKKQCKIIFIDKELTIKVIIDCKTTSAHIHSPVYKKIRIQTIWCCLNERIISANKDNELIWRRKNGNII